MKFFERSDTRFVTQAANDSERVIAIERLSEVRRTAFCGALLLSGCFLIIFILGAFHDGRGQRSLRHWIVHARNVDYRF